MGNMKTWWILGFERWGGLKPFEMWKPDGKCFRPLVFGIWIRHPTGDKPCVSDRAIRREVASESYPAANAHAFAYEVMSHTRPDYSDEMSVP